MNNTREEIWSSSHPAVERLLQRLAHRIEDFVGKAAPGTSPDMVDAFRRGMLTEVRGFAETHLDHTHELIRIGMALSAEKNIDRLLEMIVGEARRFTNADGCTLYIRDKGREELVFSIVQNDSLGVFMGGSGGAISWHPVPLRLEGGQENHRNVSAYCALTGSPVNIPDVYQAEGFDFQGTRKFDQSTGYRSKSMLVIPLKDHEDAVIGVLQLLNAKDRSSGEIVPFPVYEQDMVMSLASEAAVALTKIRLISELENLLDAFVQVIGTAIDEKSPYTAGHIARVADFTCRIAEEVNLTHDGPFAGIHYTEDELKEIRMAAWLHDIGKITTPEYFLDKSTKLESIFDRMEIIRHRIEIVRQKAKCCQGKVKVESREAADTSEAGRMPAENEPQPGGPAPPKAATCTTLTLPCKCCPDAAEGYVAADGSEDWEEILSFLDRANMGHEWLSDEVIERLRDLSAKKYEIGGNVLPILSHEELENLCVRKGTLNDHERSIMNRHVEMTIELLNRLPFPTRLRNVPLYAGMHHEKLNGKGYPRGLKGAEIPLPARMLAIADIFEALTAADRPYRPIKTLSESIAILEKMVDGGELDGDLVDLIVRSGLVARYAKKVLLAGQQDDFIWRGESFSLEEEREA